MKQRQRLLEEQAKALMEKRKPKSMQKSKVIEEDEPPQVITLKGLERGRKKNEAAGGSLESKGVLDLMNELVSPILANYKVIETLPEFGLNKYETPLFVAILVNARIYPGEMFEEIIKVFDKNVSLLENSV